MVTAHLQVLTSLFLKKNHFADQENPRASPGNARSLALPLSPPPALSLLRPVGSLEVLAQFCVSLRVEPAGRSCRGPAEPQCAPLATPARLWRLAKL